MADKEELYLSPMINAMCSSDDTFKSNTSLGNTLFKLAGGYALAKATNRTFSNYYIKEFCERLKRQCNYNHGDTIFRFFLNDNIPSVMQTLTVEELLPFYDENMIKLIEMSKEHCIAIGNHSHLGYPLYFSKYNDEIISIFSIPEDILNSFKHDYKELFDPTFTPISIHMRLNNTSVPVDENIEIIYYYLAVEHINKTVTNPLFFLFSDNINKAKEIINKTNAKNIICISNKLDYLDLYLISLCHHHITSASTFSWWASYLSRHVNKMVIYPKYYYTYLSFAGFSHEKIHREYYLDNAICI